MAPASLRRITPKTAAWARDRADIFPATYTYGWVRTEHRLTHSDRLQSTQAVDLQTHGMRHQSAADASQQLHFDAGTCAGSGLGSGLGLQQHTCCSASQMRPTLCMHSGSRSCNHKSSSVRCLWHRQARRSENRACEARGSVDMS